VFDATIDDNYKGTVTIALCVLIVIVLVGKGLDLGHFLLGEPNMQRQRQECRVNLGPVHGVIMGKELNVVLTQIVQDIVE
jgi:hypothetical protein